MTTSPNPLLRANLKSLRLPTMLGEHDKLARDAAASNQTFEDYLLRLTELELAARSANALTARIMAMGKRKPVQETLFISYQDLPRSGGHPFYVKLNQLLGQAGFDTWLEKRCVQYYVQDERRGQPSIPPGVYFRMLLVGYFENIDSQRGIGQGPCFSSD